MKISIIGAGNMGGAIACGLLKAKAIAPTDLTVIDHKGKNVEQLHQLYPEMNIVVAKYESLTDADMVIIAVKPWMVQDVLHTNSNYLEKPNQIIASVAGGISLGQLQGWMDTKKTLCRIMPNTAIALCQSMTFIATMNATPEQQKQIADIFSQLGKVETITENLFGAAASLTSCGIAFAMRYIRAAMEGGVEMGFYPTLSKEFVVQTLRGAIELLETNGTHPEVEIDKVTTAGGTTIKGLNEMEHAGFTSAVIRGLKASSN